MTTALWWLSVFVAVLLYTILAPPLIGMALWGAR